MTTSAQTGEGHAPTSATLTLDKDQLVRWLTRWLAKYPTSYDDEIATLAGSKAFDLQQLAVIYRWKFRGNYVPRKIADLTQKCTDAQAFDWTARALACTDDLAALCTVSILPSIRAAGASAVLMAGDPNRFTVMDKRAIRSLAALGLWDRETQGSAASYHYWLDYLDACRKVAKVAGWNLRDVDRALNRAKGRP